MFNYFEMHLVEHCNLNCRSCDNFSPLAKEQFIEYDEFARNIERISELAKDKIFRIRLLGGEPLLHPNLLPLLTKARKELPNTEILLTTNGILLSQMPDTFWECCHSERIVIEITYYPVKIDREKYTVKAKQFDVVVIPFMNVEMTVKVTHRNPVNSIKDQDADFNYSHCYQVGNCTTLKDCKIYPCTCIPNIVHFNNYFNKNLKVTKKDYIDINQVQSVEEIDKFLEHSVPFCKYCDVRGRSDGAKWGITKYEIREWYNER